jgi:orotate phosphoribosyltransferase
MQIKSLDFISFLYKKNCIKIASNKDEFFLLKSKRLCPIFINIGGLIDGGSLDFLANAYAFKIKQLMDQKELEKFDFIYGPAYKGIPLAALCCAMLYRNYNINVKMIYDRKEEKDYGDKKADSLIVGQDQLYDGAKVLMIDDVITSGKAKIDAYKKLINTNKIKMIGVLVAVDRQEIGQEQTSASEEIEKLMGCKLYSLANISEIYNSLIDVLTKEQKKYILEYWQKWGEKKIKFWIEQELKKI